MVTDGISDQLKAWVLSQDLASAAVNISTLVDLVEEQRLDTNEGKQVLSCHICLINTGVEKMNNV